MKKTLLLITAVSTLCYMSCKKENPIQNADPALPAAGISAPEGFDYKTTKDINIDIALSTSGEEPIAGVIVAVYDPADDDMTDPIFKGITDKNGHLIAQLNIQSTTTELIVDPAYVGLMRNARVSIKGNTASATIGGKNGFNGDVVPEIMNRTPKTGLRVTDVTATNFVWPEPYTSVNDAVRDDIDYPLFLGIPKYLEPQPDVISAEMLRLINNSLPESVPVMEHHPEYLRSNILPAIRVVKTSPVSVTFVSEGASYQNTLAYYTYPTNNPPKTADDIKKATFIFPNTSVGGSGGALKPGSKVNLGTFTAGTTIGFIVLRNSWTSADVETGVNKFYSNSALNPEANRNLRKHAIILNDVTNNQFVIGFEDIMREEAICDHDFNDIVIFAKSAVDGAIDPGDVPIIDENPDTDGDGVPNVKDEYPTDPDRAYNDYYPSNKKFAQWGFEDNWPNKGDYDMNDIVMNYRYKFVLNGQNDVVDLYLTFDPIAAGASFKNGFGLELPVNADAVKSVSGQLIKGNYITFAANGVEAGQSKAVIIPFDNHDNVLSYPDGSFFINTKPEKDKVDGKNVVVTILLNAPLNRSEFKISGFNPFVISNLTRGREVHLPGYTPTDKADKTLFGTADDTSNPGTGRYYVAVNNLPWGISYMHTTKYAIETVNINQAYNHYDEWVSSGGTAYPDWYEYRKPGYANLENLYMK